ncbi:hypothetical protein [Streptomyces sp. NBC_00470]|uniref:hypothetical protein n=1 Tax=Streptomyces sp. NBC_00470 TaxID=2975753 RepID=UPI002F90D5C6
MGTKTGRDTVPSSYQAQLLRDALTDAKHRLPTDARRSALNVMRRRRWIVEYTPGSSRAATRGGSGFTRFRLSHHGVNAARRLRA